MSEGREKRDLVLPPGSYAYMQDTTKGIIKTYAGPTVINQTAQDMPVRYNSKAGTFEKCSSLEESVRLNPVAVEGFYVTLLNPAKKDNRHPDEGQATASAELDIGRKVNIPGPANFALWPGQAATVIRGHHLRSNQYLLVRVYNEDEARRNWSKAVIKLADPSTGSDPSKTEGDTKTQVPEVKVTALPPTDLTVGKLFIIRGTEVSFYIPPTGITVVEDGKDTVGKPVYVREALTLERLEYSILVDENGRKRYEYGPAVVFPQPTERFIQSKDDRGEPTKKFRAIELNELQGIHIKVIADYTDDKTKKSHKAGDELFITGKDTAIYYPREEHSAIKYDGKTKHFSTAVPAGEARYVMNRMTGDIKMVKGPAMLLPDPRTEIIVRRVLSEKQAGLWYPGNAEVMEYNRGLRALVAQAPTTRTGTVSEGELERKTKGALRSRSLGDTNMNIGAAYLSASAAPVAAAAAALMESSQVSKEQGYVGDEFVRGSTYTAPRSITLETKFQGVPTIELWTNYAAMFVSKSGGRRVEVGPKTVLLGYDESMEVLELSTGKPKTTDNLLKTVYLRVENNKVADIVQVETIDHVQVELRLSYLVNFEGEEKEKWFAVENYVKFLCDHVRSVLKGAIRKTRIEDFYTNSTDVIRSILLGADKKGMLFEANHMRMSDVEVLGVTIRDDRIRQLLDNSQLLVVQTNIEVSNLKRNLDVTKEKESLSREEAQTRAETTKLRNELDKELLASSLALTLAKLACALQELDQQKKLVTEKQELEKQEAESKVSIDKMLGDRKLEQTQAEQTQRIEFLKAEAEATISKFKAVEGNFTNALMALSNNETLIKAAEAWSFQKVVGGENITDALSKVFAGTPLAALVKQVAGNGAPIVAKSTTGQQPAV